MGDLAEIQMGIQHTKHHLNCPFFWIIGLPPELLQLFELRLTRQQFNSPIKYADQIVLHNLNDSFNLWTHYWWSECTANSMMIPSCESSMNCCLNQLLDPHIWLPLLFKEPQDAVHFRGQKSHMWPDEYEAYLSIWQETVTSAILSQADWNSNMQILKNTLLGVNEVCIHFGFY